MEYDRLGFSIADVCRLVMGLKPGEFRGTSESDSHPGAPTADWYLKPVRCPATCGIITLYIKFSIKGKLLLISFHEAGKGKTGPTGSKRS